MTWSSSTCSGVHPRGPSEWCRLCDRSQIIKLSTMCGLSWPRHNHLAGEAREHKRTPRDSSSMGLSRHVTTAAQVTPPGRWLDFATRREQEEIVAISVKLPTTRPQQQKSYHPNIRLPSSWPQPIMCLILLTLVPTIQCSFNHQPSYASINQPNNNSHHHHHQNLYNHRLSGGPSEPAAPASHANQPLTPSNHRPWAGGHTQNTIQSAQVRPSSASGQVPAQRRTEGPLQQQQHHLMNPYQAYQLQPVRPAKLMAEYVANQGQRILKNLVNTTIADLVVQSTMKMNANKLSSPPTGPSTTIGKLYTLLFPTPSPLLAFAAPLQQLSAQQHSTGSNQTNRENAALTGSGASSSSGQQSEGSLYGMSEQQGRDEKQQFLSLSAPYDSQPRPRRPKRLRNSGLPSDTSADDSWRAHSGHTDAPEVGSLTADSIFDHQQLESIGDEMTADQGSLSRPEMDSLGAYESSGSEFMHPRDDGSGSRKPPPPEMELYSSHNLNQQVVDDQVQLRNFTPEVDLSAAFGRARGRKLADMADQYQPQMDNHNHLSQVHGQLLQTQESADVSFNSSDTSSSLDASNEFLPPMARSQRQPKHYQHKHDHDHQVDQEQSVEEAQRPAHDHHDHDHHHLHQHPQDFQEQELANQQIMIESRNRNLSELDVGMQQYHHQHQPTQEVVDTASSSAAEQAALRGMFNDSSSPGQPDDSFFSEQLPRQYEAVMRLPPEGYYDDYFKPSTVASQASLHPNNFYHNQETLSSMAEFTPGQSSGLARNPHVDGPYDNLVEELSTVANQSSHEQVSSGGEENKKKKTKQPPSYKSEIVTTEAQFNNNLTGHKYSQPTVGYTEQYFLNQKAMKESSETPSDARLDFVGANRTLVSSSSSPASDKGNLESLNYEIPSVYEKISANQSLDMPNNYMSSNNNTHSMPRNLTLSSEPSISTQQVNRNLLNEDSIKLIIANTISSARDPRSNEKVINYTSDGFNITRGKSPRNNFVNKDMNEFPPVEIPTFQQQQQPLGQVEGATGAGGQVGGPQGGQRGLMPQPVQVHNQPMITTSSGGANSQQQQVARQRQPNNGHLARSSVDHQHRTPAPALQPDMDQLTTERADYKEELVAQSPGEAGEPDDERRSEGEGAYEQYNMRRIPAAPEARKNNGRDQPTRPPPPVDEPHEQHHNEHHLSHVEQQPQMPASDQPAEGANDEPDRIDDSDRDRDDRHRATRNRKQQEQRRAERRQRERRTRHKGKFSKQHTIQRPQVTQVSLNPKQLIVRPPPPPVASASESPLEAIAEIPHKVEQLRENQPDKNELMNELLTALDRVKVAIYKLQPLTAKMNAIYRKSVTSNTRNIIMDNHKGTYAKRYPPGDYDDTYDSMRQSDPLNLQSRTSSPRSDTRQSADQPSQQVDGQQLDANESVESAVFVPAPREILEKHKRDIAGLDGAPVGVRVTNVELDSLSALESKIVATGIGRRLGHGRIAGQLRLDSGEKLTYDDDGGGGGGIEDMALANSTLDHHSLQSFLPHLNGSSSTGGEDIMEPLFGYRITIYRSPEAEAEEAQPNQEHLVYQMEGEDEEEPTGGGEEDSMATSESTMVGSTQQQQVLADERGPKVIVVESSSDQMDESESKGKKSMEKSDKKKSKKSQSKKKKQEEESKKKKEYKKIKHNKGLMSKEKKTMHRDKHIKAHDRGAAKEKALKERTQIEFFEREQIVDDEYEKGKKTTVKGGWQTGQDSKKTLKDGDNMSMGGSHFVKHEPKETDKGHSVSAEASSAKKSNKFEKKQMEAKGKKFKGWREKGYKIITETEFIDRGSLHDSAYKKRDKGAAHHHKFKKQEASSEGHHGSLLEHHKKSHKKEEKKSNEKKGEEMKKKKVKGKKKSHKGEEGGEESAVAATAEPDADGKEPLEHNESRHGKESPRRDEYKRGQRPMLMSASSTTFRPTVIIHSPESSQTRTLLRLLNSNVHDEPTKSGHQLVDQDGQKVMPNVGVSSSHNNNSIQQQSSSSLASGRADPNNNSRNNEQSKYQLLNYTLNDDTTNRRSDMSSTAPARGSKNSRSLFSNNNPLHGNSTILNIVDNLTGRQINKTKIGTYDLEDHHTVHLNHNTLSNSNSNNNNNNSSSTPLIRISNGLAKYFPFLAQPNQPASLTNKPSLNQAIQTNVLLHPTSFNTPPNPATISSTTTTTTTTSTTTKPSHNSNIQIKQPDKVEMNGPDLLNLNKHNQFLNYNLPQSIHNINNNNALNRAHSNHQFNQQNLGNPIRISGPTSHPVIAMGGPTTRPPNYITPAQANAAAQLLQLVHRANQMTHTDPNLANHQSNNLLDLQQQLNPLQGSIPRAAFMHPPTMTNSFHHHQPAQMFQPPINYSPQPGPSFGAEHFIDYEHDPILQHHHHHHAAAHNFLTD